jgi:adenine C2-methylase RlmN of 23S rRNA A2503 and tRNA A37
VFEVLTDEELERLLVKMFRAAQMSDWVYWAITDLSLEMFQLWQEISDEYIRRALEV